MHEGEQRLDELFFSRTDTSGRIRSGNDVFARVSGYPLEEMLGQPHSLVRHPDTPRAAFSFFWEVLGQGRPVAAYVKNRTKAGRHYWVMASAFPVEGGHLSIRLTPTSPLFAHVQELYRQVCAAEAAAERDLDGDGAGSRRRDRVVAAGREALLSGLSAHGFAGYEQFMQNALCSEVAARAESLGHDLTAGWARPAEHDRRPLAQLLLTATRTHEDMRRLVGDLSGYARIGEQLVEQSRYVRSLAEDVRVFSFNALFASTRLGRAGVALSATAALMRDGSNSAGRLVTDLSSDIDRVLETMAELRFRIANAQLRVEASVSFLTELLDTQREDEPLDPLRREDIRALTASLDRGVDRLLDSLGGMDTSSQALLDHVAALGRELDTLNVLQMNGRVEAARVAADASVTSLFSTIGEQVRTAISRMERFADVAQLAVRDTEAEVDAREQLDRAGVLVAQLA